MHRGQRLPKICTYYKIGQFHDVCQLINILLNLLPYFHDVCQLINILLNLLPYFHDVCQLINILIIIPHICHRHHRRCLCLVQFSLRVKVWLDTCFSLSECQNDKWNTFRCATSNKNTKHFGKGETEVWCMKGPNEAKMWRQIKSSIRRRCFKLLHSSVRSAPLRNTTKVQYSRDPNSWAIFTFPLWVCGKLLIFHWNSTSDSQLETQSLRFQTS